MELCVLFVNSRQPSAICWHAAQFPVCHKCPEWDKRGQEEDKAELQFPAVGQLGMEKAQAIQDKEDAMGPPAVSDVDFLMPNVLQGHGKPEEQEKGNALQDPGDTKPSNYCGKHCNLKNGWNIKYGIWNVDF
tara:strand:+ start:471 stop:866 length:396 start_codon:yes stop_codon:yes gene_type:complete